MQVFNNILNVSPLRPKLKDFFHLFFQTGQKVENAYKYFELRLFWWGSCEGGTLNILF